jgi:hypothetical protein
MNTFTYTARTKDGSTKSGKVNASNRVEALRQLKAMDLLPLSLSGARAEETGSKQQVLRKMLASLVAVGLLALCCGVGLWLYSGTKTKPGLAVKKPTQERQNNPKKTNAKKATPSTINKMEQPAEKMTSKQPSNPNTRASRAMTTNTAELVVEKKPDEPKHFPSMTEQLLAMTASIPPGVEAPPLPDLQYAGLENDYTKASTNVLVITEKDDEKLASLKEKVAWQKVDVSELVKQGYKLSDILEAIRAEHNENASIRRSTVDYLKDFIKDEATLKTVREDLPGLNLKLREKNLPEIELHELGILDD